MSFEARIGLALKGSNWQELQNKDMVPPATATTSFVEGSSASDTEVVKGEVDRPPEWTTKQLKKKANFDRAITRDAGDLLSTIEVSSITPVTQNVTWNQEPELLCCYNWQASTDGTNTIFGKS
jgi:hypothetical protein